MDIIYLIINIFENVFQVFLYLMPFGLFDSASYFMDIYSNPLFITILFILSFIMGFVFLVYFVEMLNIHVNDENLQGIKLSEEEERRSPTFLSELLNFILGKSNFGTFFPILVKYFMQVRLKIIPILVVIMMLYIPLLPTSRGYNTVGEFFFANRDIIIYSLPGMSGKSDEDIKRMVQYAALDKTQLPNSEFFKDQSIVLKDLTEDTIGNTKLNNTLAEEVNLYQTVYNDASYKATITKISTDLTNLKATLKDLEAKKDIATSKQAITDYINQINQTKDNINELSIRQKSIDSVYKNLNYKVNIDELKPYRNTLNQSINYNTLLLNFNHNKTAVNTNRMKSDDLLKIYDNTVKNIDLLIKTPNDITYKSLGVIDDSEKSTMSNIYNYAIKDNKNNPDIQKKLLEIKGIILSEKNNITAYEPVTISNKEKDLTQKLYTAENDYKNISNIEKDPSARLSYIIDQNAKKIATTVDNEPEKQALLLLQYKLLTQKNNIDPLTGSVKLLGNRVEYVGSNVLRGMSMVITLITYVFKFIYYSSLVFLAGWKNMLILYISTLGGFMKRVNKFIEGTKLNENLKNHLSTVTSAIFPNGEDRELQWYYANMEKRETYIMILMEFLIRFGVIYWFVNL